MYAHVAPVNLDYPEGEEQGQGPRFGLKKAKQKCRKPRETRFFYSFLLFKPRRLYLEAHSESGNTVTNVYLAESAFERRLNRPASSAGAYVVRPRITWNNKSGRGTWSVSPRVQLGVKPPVYPKPRLREACKPLKAHTDPKKQNQDAGPETGPLGFPMELL